MAGRGSRERVAGRGQGRQDKLAALLRRRRTRAKRTRVLWAREQGPSSTSGRHGSTSRSSHQGSVATVGERPLGIQERWACKRHEKRADVELAGWSADCCRSCRGAQAAAGQDGRRMGRLAVSQRPCHIKDNGTGAARAGRASRSGLQGQPEHLQGRREGWSEACSCSLRSDAAGALVRGRDLARALCPASRLDRRPVPSPTARRPPTSSVTSSSGAARIPYQLADPDRSRGALQTETHPCRPFASRSTTTTTTRRRSARSSRSTTRSRSSRSGQPRPSWTLLEDRR